MSEPTIALIGLDHGDSAAIRAALELASGIELSRWRIVDDPERADVVIGAEGSPLPAPGERGRIGIVVAETQAGESAHWLPRPITYAALVRLMKAVQLELTGHGSPVVAAPPPPSAEQSLGTDEAPASATSSQLETPPSDIAEQPATAGHDAPSGEPDTEDFTAVELEPEIATAAIDIEDFSEIDLTDAGRQAAGEEEPPSAAENEAETTAHAIEPESVAGIEISSAETAVSLLDEIGDEFDDLTESLSDTASSETTTPSEPRISIPDLTHPTQAPVGGDEQSATVSDAGMRAPSPALDLDAIIRPARRFYPQMRFLGLLRQLIADGEICQVSHPYYPTVDIHPQEQWFSFAGDLELAHGLFRAPAHELSTHYPGHARQPRPANDPHARPLWALVYTATLYGSEGRLLDGADAHARLRLRKLPDSRVIPWSSEYQRIATYISDYAANLSQITTVTQISIKTVIDFTNACREIGLIEVVDERQPADAAARIAPDDKPRRGWMSRIRSTLNRLVVKNAE